MVIAHYGYLVLKMPSPAGVLTVRGDRTAAIAAVERLHALAAEAARSEEDPSTSDPGRLQRHLRFSRLIRTMFP